MTIICSKDCRYKRKEWGCIGNSGTCMAEGDILLVDGECIHHTAISDDLNNYEELTKADKGDIVFCLDYDSATDSEPKMVAGVLSRAFKFNEGNNYIYMVSLRKMLDIGSERLVFADKVYKRKSR